MPTLPFGAHRVPMRRDADLSLRGIGRIVAELLDALHLHDVTLCFNDWGGAQVMIGDGLDASGGWADACEAFENSPGSRRDRAHAALADDRTAAPAPVHVREHVQARRARSS